MTSPLIAASAPAALTAVLWLASGIILGILPPFPPMWLSMAVSVTAVLAFRGLPACAAGAGASIPVAGVAWYLSRHGGRHEGHLAVRTAAGRER